MMVIEAVSEINSIFASSKNHPMKKISFFILVLISPAAYSAVNINSELFRLDEQKLGKAMRSLDMMENDVLAGKIATLPGAYQDPFSSLSDFGPGRGDGPPVLPSFCWGFLFIPIGVAVVYLSSEEKEDRLSSIYGAATSGIILTVYYVLITLNKSHPIF